MLYGVYFLLNYKKINRNIILSLLSFLILTLPILLKSFMTSSSVYNFNQWIIFIKLRVPGHFFLTEWPFLNTFMFFILILMFIVSLNYKADKTKNDKVIILSLGTLLLMIISFIFTEVYPISYIIQSSFFRGVIIPRVVAIIYVINFIFNSFKHNSKKLMASGMALLLVLTITIPFFVGEHKGVFDEINLDKPITLWEDVSIKSKELTPLDSLFITPLFSLGFTFFSERSEFINWKNSGVGIYSGQYVSEAFNRFSFVCKHDFEFGSRAELVEECAKGYDNLNEKDLETAKEQYGVTHIIVNKPKELNFNLIYENEEYRIYEL